MKLTPWFDASVYPRRYGWYDVRCTAGHYDDVIGRFWFGGNLNWISHCDQWRGILKSPKRAR